MEEIFYTGLLALIEQDGFQAVRKSTSRGGQYNGSCPWCGGNDRFRVQPHHGPYGWYACNQCEHKGNAVSYLMDMRGFSKQDALLAVGWKPKDGSELHRITPDFAYDARPQWDEPPERWQYAARDFYRACQETLWSDAGRAALDYLRGRGLADGTIKFATLGYHAQEEYGPAHIWGRPKAVKLSQGIVIPWLYEGNVWRLTIRDERVVSGDGRYKQVSGGSNGLYLADSLRFNRPAVVVTEGEFDALSVAQEYGKQVAVVATGTTQGGHTPRWIGLLERQQRAMIAFDGEEKGDHAAHWWLTRLSNAQRLRPLWKDANQMLQDGADLAEWITTYEIHPAQTQTRQPAPEPASGLLLAQEPQQAEYSTPEPLAPIPTQPEHTAPDAQANKPAPRTGSNGRQCLTQIYLSEKHPRHIGFPSWIDPKAKNFVGWEARNAYLRGDIDVMGNWWCGMCFFRCQLINRGAMLGYPELPPEYRIEGYPGVGYEAWLALAQYGGSVHVETAVRWDFAPADQKWRVIDYSEQARAFLATH